VLLALDSESVKLAESTVIANMSSLKFAVRLLLRSTLMAEFCGVVFMMYGVLVSAVLALELVLALVLILILGSESELEPPQADRKNGSNISEARCQWFDFFGWLFIMLIFMVSFFRKIVLKLLP